MKILNLTHIYMIPEQRSKNMHSTAIRSSSGSRTGSRASTSSRGGSGTSNLKSTVFYPVAMSPTARHDVVNHMNAHYRRVNGAKAMVDTSTPKTFLMRRSPSPASTRPNSRSSSRTQQSSQVGSIQNEAIVRTSSRINYYLEALRREQQRLLTQVTSQTAHFRRVTSAAHHDQREQHQRPRRPWPDLMDVHAEHFTPSDRPFVPRLLRTSAKSRVQEYRWYNPPRRKLSEDAGSPPDSDVSPSPSSSAKLPDRFDGTFEEDHTLMTDGEVESDGSEELRTLGRGSRLGSDRLRSSRSRVVNGDQNPARKEPKPLPLRGDSTRELERWPAGVKGHHHHANGNLKPTARESLRNDEAQYLEFVVDVTNDILMRGIYTNRVLKQVFRFHLDKRKDDLNAEKMEAALKKLQEDLEIPETADGDRAMFGYGRNVAGHSEQRLMSIRGELERTRHRTATVTHDHTHKVFANGASRWQHEGNGTGRTNETAYSSHSFAKNAETVGASALGATQTINCGGPQDSVDEARHNMAELLLDDAEFYEDNN